MPPAAPVTMATLPSNRPMIIPPLCRLGDELGFQVFLETGQTHLAADSGLLVAAERRVDRVPDAAVDPDRAGPDPAGHRPGPGQVAAVHGAGQPVRRVVGDPHRVVVPVV